MGKIQSVIDDVKHFLKEARAELEKGDMADP